MLRVAVHLRPGAARDHVGGRFGEGEPVELSCSVRARADAGAANRAAVVVLARAFSLAPSKVRLLRGARSRHKLFELDGGAPERLAELLEHSEQP
jgi:uncharacterized protein